MSVVPVPPIPPVAPVSPGQRDSRPVSQGRGGSFEENFARALAESGAGNGEKGKLLADVLRLQMMRGLVSLDFEEGEGSDRLLASFLPEFSLGGRNLDPSLSAVKESGPPVPAKEAPPGSIDAIVDRAARRYQVAPELVKAVIRAESGFNPTAVSPAGAQGLMQLMPGTARDLGVRDPFNPEQNVMGGTRYLRQMLDRYDGNVEKALAAYNWGPGNVDRGDRGLPRETREYIGRIKGYLAREA